MFAAKQITQVTLLMKPSTILKPVLRHYSVFVPTKQAENH